MEWYVRCGCCWYLRVFFFHLKTSLSLKYIRTTRSICIIHTEERKKIYDSHHTVTLEQW